MENVLRWLNNVLKKRQFVNRIGRVKFAEEPTFYLLPEPIEETKEPMTNSKRKAKAKIDAKKMKE